MKTSLYPSIETCKKIKHLFDETRHWYIEHPNGWITISYIDMNILSKEEIVERNERGFIHTPCPDVMELLYMLPDILIQRRFNFGKFSDYCVSPTEGNSSESWLSDKSLPEALGLLLHKLDEEKLI